MNKFHSDGAVAAKRMEKEEENSAQLTKEAVTNTGINNNQDSTLDDVWNEDDGFILEDETVGDKGKNRRQRKQVKKMKIIITA